MPAAEPSGKAAVQVGLAFGHIRSRQFSFARSASILSRSSDEGQRGQNRGLTHLRCIVWIQLTHVNGRRVREAQAQAGT